MYANALLKDPYEKTRIKLMTMDEITSCVNRGWRIQEPLPYIKMCYPCIWHFYLTSDNKKFYEYYDKTIINCIEGFETFIREPNPIEKTYKEIPVFSKPPKGLLCQTL